MECVNTITFNSFPPSLSLSLSPDITPANVTIHPHNTSDGYFRTIVTLLKGITGLVVQVINANGSMQFEQHINRSGSVQSTIRLPRGNYTVKVYQKMSNGTFNVSCPIKREKGSIKSSNGFHPQIIIDYLQTLLLAFSSPCWA